MTLTDIAVENEWTISPKNMENNSYRYLSGNVKIPYTPLNFVFKGILDSEGDVISYTGLSAGKSLAPAEISIGKGNVIVSNSENTLAQTLTGLSGGINVNFNGATGVSSGGGSIIEEQGFSNLWCSQYGRYLGGESTLRAR